MHVSESKVKILGFYYRVLLRSLSLKVDWVALYVNGFDGTDKLTSSTTHTEFLVGLGYGQSALKRYHMQRLDRAMLGACSATGTVYVYHADVFAEYHMARLCGMFLLHGKRPDCAGGTNLAAQVAVIVAIAVVKLHYRLHDASQTVFHSCGLEHMAWTLAHAQMA